MNEDQTRPVTPDPPPPPGVPDIDVTDRSEHRPDERDADPDQDVGEHTPSPEPPD